MRVPWVGRDATRSGLRCSCGPQMMRNELFELAALEVFEAGKTWREAGADVGEAIDFLEYYGRRCCGWSGAKGQEAGEQNQDDHRPWGVGVVIAPWNFPWPSLRAHDKSATRQTATPSSSSRWPTP